MTVDGSSSVATMRRPSTGRQHALAGLAVVLAAVLFGTTGTARALGPADTSAFAVGTLRIVIGSAALWVFARSWPQWWVVGRWPWPVMAGGVGVAIYQPAFFTGTARSGVALGTVVALGSGPVFAGVIEWVRFGRPPGRVWMLATAVTLAGGALIVVDSAGGGGGAGRLDAVGMLASLAAGLGYATYAISAKLLIDRGVHSTVALAWPFTAGAVMLAPFLLTQRLDWVSTWSGAVMLAHLGVVTVGVAYVLYGWGLRSIATSSAVTLTLAEPLTAALAAVVVLGERLQPVGWVGAALVVVGLVLAGRARPSGDVVRD